MPWVPSRGSGAAAAAAAIAAGARAFSASSSRSSFDDGAGGSMSKPAKDSRVNFISSERSSSE